MDETKRLREELAIKDVQITQLKGWMINCDRMDDLEYDNEKKDIEIEALRFKATGIKRKLEKTELERDECYVHMDDKEDRITCMQEFIASEEMMHKQAISEHCNAEMELTAKLNDAEIVIKDTRSNQGRPFTDHRNALTFKEQLKHTQKEHATLTNKYEHLIGSHNSAITALRSHEMEAERRKAHAEEEKVISDRIQKNLDALQEKPTNPRARSASTQTQHSETLKADDQVKYLQEKLDEKTHQNELLISKQKHWTGTITSLRKRLEVRRKINENFRTHSANQLGNIGWLSNQRTTLHDRIKQLEREMLRPAGHSSRGGHGKANANELAHKLKKAKAKITCLSDDIRKKDKQIEDHQRWTNGMPVIFEPIPENTNTLEQKDLHIQKLTFQLAERDNQYTALLSITERDKAAGSARRVN